MTDKQRESREIIEKSRTIGELTVKVNVDISEALAGLKALQRETKETIKALRELEAQKCGK